jgi:hypothetical protein
MAAPSIIVSHILPRIRSRRCRHALLVTGSTVALSPTLLALQLAILSASDP